MGAISLLIVATALTAEAAEPAPRGVSHLKLRAEARVQADTATLGDVLIFGAADPQLRQAVGPQPVVADLPLSGATAVTHEQVERLLDAAGVNLSRVLLGGAPTCRVTLEPPAGPAEGADDDEAGVLLREPAPRASSGGQSLAQVLRAHLNRELAELEATAEVDFERASQPFLGLTTPPWEFSIRPRGHEKLGLREFRVVLRRDGKTHRTVSVFARVRASKRVVVARKPLSVGSYVQHDALGLETRTFDSERDFGLDRIEQVVGQQVARFIPTGGMLQREALKSVDMVRRSRPVTITSAAKSVRIRATGVALDSGGYGDSVRVRLEGARNNRRVLRGVVTGPGTVKVEEDRR